MRLYSFVNYYLSPLQHGLQTAHCVSELSVAGYAPDSLEFKIYNEWATKHKTIIICNGGNSGMLHDTWLEMFTICSKLKLPLVKFYEDEQSLNGALTSVAVVVPDMYYDVKQIADDPAYLFLHYYFSDKYSKSFRAQTPEYKLIELIKSHRLA